MDPRNDGTARLDRLLPSTLDSVEEAESLVTEIAQQCGFDEDTLFKLGMAVREAMVNAVVHGNRYSERKTVRLTVTGSPEKLALRIIDEGDGFDVAAIPDPTAAENLLRQSGRGLLLIRSFVDEVRIEPAQPKGTSLEIVKYRK